MPHFPNFINSIAHGICSRRRHQIGEHCEDSCEGNSPNDDCTRYIGSAETFQLGGSYSHIKDLQEGRDGQCSLVKSDTTGKLFVLKQSRAGERPARRNTPHEVRYLNLLEPHTNIIHLFATEQCPSAPGRHNLYLEVCSCGDLLEQQHYFHNNKVQNFEIFTLHVFIGLAQALAYIHHNLRYEKGKYTKAAHRHEPIIHGDIKADNILLRWPGKECAVLPDIVLADFGQAQLACESWGIAGTPGLDSPEVDAVAIYEHSDPEVYRQKKNARILTPASDIYQMGLVVHCLATGSNFKRGNQNPGAIQLPPSHEKVDGLLPAIQWCLQRDPKKRPECSEKSGEGMLLLVDLFRVQRDEMAAKSPLDKKVWNILDLKSLLVDSNSVSSG